MNTRPTALHDPTHTMPVNPTMLSNGMPTARRAEERNPLHPSSMIHTYAPRNGGVTVAMAARVRMAPLPGRT